MLVQAVPADDSTDVAVSSNLQLHFSDNVQAGTGSIVLHKADGSVVHSFAVGSDPGVTFAGSTVTIDPPSDLALSQDYYLTIDAGALVGSNGVAYAGLSTATALNFRTTSSQDDDYPTSAPGAVATDGTPSTGRIEVPGDSDAFAVQLQAGHAYSFALARTSGALDVMLSVVGPGGAVEASDHDSGGSKTGDARILNFIPSSTGTYYVKAADESSATGTYALAALHHGIPTPDDHSNGFEGATGLAVGGQAVAGRIELAEDNDMFKVALIAGTTYNFTLVRNDDGGLSSPYLNLYQPDGTWGGYSYARDEPTITLNYTATVSGEHYLNASGLDLSTGGYEVSVAIDGTPLVAPTLTSASPSDDASYVSLDSAFHLTFSHPVKPGQGSIVIRHADGTVDQTIDVADFTQVQFDNRTMVLNPAGDLARGRGYYIEIDAGAILSTQGLAFAGLSGPTAYNFTTVPPPDDYPWSTDTTGVVTVGGVASSGQIETSHDGDMFAVQLEAGHSYVFRLDSDGSPGGLDPSLTLLNPSGKAILTDDDSGSSAGSARIAFNASTTATYYLGVQDEAWGIGGYKLTAIDAPPPTLAGTSPADNATGVAVDANLQLQFSQPVAAGQGDILIRDAGNGMVRVIPVADTTQVHFDGNTVTIDPQIDLEPGRPYFVEIYAGTIVGSNGAPFAGVTGGSAFNFVTASPPDDFPWSTSTAGHVTVGGPATHGRIEAADDADMFGIELQAGVAYSIAAQRDASQPGALEPRLVLLTSTGEVLRDVHGWGGVDDPDAQLYFTPATSGTYYVGVMDEGRGTGSYQVSATTDVPLVYGHYPENGAIDVNPSTPISFSVTKPFSLGQGTVLIRDSSGAVRFSIPTGDWNQISANGYALYINPSFDFELGQTYTVDLPPGLLLDANGQPHPGLEAPVELTFTTQPLQPDDWPNSPGGAAQIAIGGTRSGQFDYYGDHDMFRADLVAGRTYEFALKAVDPTSGLLTYLALLDASGHALPVHADTIPGTAATFRIGFTAPSSGTYYLDAMLSGNLGAYQLSAAAVTDDFLAATGTSGRLTMNGAATSGQVQSSADVDWFKVSLTAGRMVHVDLSGADGPLDTNLFLFNDAGAQITGTYQTSGLAGGATRLTFIAPTTGTYYVQAGTDNGETGRYQVRASFATDSVPASTTTNAVVNVPDGPRLGTLEFAGDVDYYKVDLAAGVSYDFKLTTTEGLWLSNLHLGLYSPTKAQLVATDGGSKADPQFSYTPTVSGTYYLRASDAGGNLGSYLIDVGHTDVAPPALVSLYPQSGATVSRTGAFVLRFDEPVFAGSGSIVLRNSAGAIIGSFETSDYPHLSFVGSTLYITPGLELAAATEYFIDIPAGAVRDAAGQAFAGLTGATAYRFTTASDDFDERGPNIGTLVLGAAPLQGHLEVGDDRDRFGLEVTAGQSIRLRVPGTAPGVYFELFAPDGTTAFGGGGWATFKAATSGTYHVVVFGDNPADYTIAAEIDYTEWAATASLAGGERDNEVALTGQPALDFTGYDAP
ncbi:Ig-like domain-containing protein [Aquabacterium humicola]|uniref:Ig-like domain-containing protein n=1 Tax=Aquabacterium humicola TaxID=3237377 RepID=UPI002543B5F7|nr:Ig-like domain-containing protein [Rubrivivax pictus]